ncbi:7-cyano-7-deazaguanine synthase QueC [Gammaproteobacteria bacterium]|nr:7-cyano-7-deazaguanine synthase QueC [Gammaproteobacteria bacterium]
MDPQNKVLIVFSGGLDSFTLLNYALDNNFFVQCITFNYGQRHLKEVDLAAQICRENDIQQTQIQIPNTELIFANSVLTSDSIDMPHGSYQAESMQATIVPNRNMLFISYAIAQAISQEINQVWYGAHAGDHFIYPDCRPEFLDAMNQVAQICHTFPISVKAPFLNFTKAEIVKLGLNLGIDYSKTWTCYEGQEIACGKCGSCNERLEAFAINNTSDPLDYKF